MSDWTPVWIIAGCVAWFGYTIGLEWWFRQ